MEKPQILYLIQFYRDALNGPVKAKRADRSSLYDPFDGNAIAHVKWMLGQPDHFWETPEKAQRWLGFIQGVLWNNGRYSVDELRAHIDKASSVKSDSGPGRPGALSHRVGADGAE
jgi:hypothetical protein